MPTGGPINLALTGGAGDATPRIGVSGGRVTPMPRGDAVGAAAPTFCSEARMRLVAIDFDERFRDLLKLARQSNVSFYPISPRGLEGVEFTQQGSADLAAYHRRIVQLDLLRTLASETDGLAIVNVNDMRRGLSRIADDLQSYYVLGYYTSNTRWDGKLRSIKVRLNPKGETIRARRQYRAPTQDEIAAMSAALTRPALPAPAPPAAAPAVIGEPIAY